MSKSSLYIATQGAIIAREGERLVVSLRHKKLSEIAIREVEQIVLFGNVEVTRPAIDLCLTRQVDIIYLNFSGRFMGRLAGSAAGNIDLRRAQFSLSCLTAVNRQVIGETLASQQANPELPLRIASAIVYGKLANCATLLFRGARNQNNAAVRDIAEGIKVDILPDVKNASSFANLRGLEGIGAKNYFNGYRGLMDPEFSFVKRIRRPPKDPINVLLSLGYTLLANQIHSIVSYIGFEPFLGIYHTPKHGRPALALDLMEEFRSVLVDACVLNSINTRSLRPNDFETAGEACTLGRPGLGRFLNRFNGYLQREIFYEERGCKVSYRRIIELQARQLAAVVTGKKSAYKAFRVR